MDKIEFKRHEKSLNNYFSLKKLEIYIDNKAFIDFITDIEIPMTLNEDDIKLAGSYSLIHISNDPFKYFHGEFEVDFGHSDDKTELLQCECISPECRSLYCKISSDQNFIDWEQ